MEDEILNDEEFTAEELKEATGRLREMILKEKLKNDVLMLALARLGGEFTFTMDEFEEIQNCHVHCDSIDNNRLKIALVLDNYCEKDKTKH